MKTLAEQFKDVVASIPPRNRTTSEALLSWLNENDPGRFGKCKINDEKNARLILAFSDGSEIDFFSALHYESYVEEKN
jgi:hypothetical protein